MPRVLYSPRARLDLRDIVDYIAPENPNAAQRIYSRIVTQCRHLAATPLIGRGREDLGPHVRSFVVWPYLIFFRPIADGVEIIRILHGKRDMPSVFLAEGAG